jgi:hypothetical protein
MTGKQTPRQMGTRNHAALRSRLALAATDLKVAS